MTIGLDPKKEYEALIQTAAANLGYTVYEASIRLKGADTKFAVKIDKPGVISIEDCESLKTTLSKYPRPVSTGSLFPKKILSVLSAHP